MPSRSASRRIASRNHTPCTRPRATMRRVTASVIAAHAAAGLFLHTLALLGLDATFLRCAGGPRLHPLLGHVIEAFELLHQALEGGLAVAMLRGRVLRSDHDARRQVREAQRRLGL